MEHPSKQHNFRKSVGDITMNNRVIALGGIAIFAIIMIITLNRRDEPDSYVLRGDSGISPEEYRLYFKTLDLDSHGMERYFADSVVNHQTLRFFKALQSRFKQMGFDEHLEAIREYLQRTMNPAKAGEMFALYKKFADYERSLLSNPKRFRPPASGADALRYLNDLQNYRREFFGADTADRLFGFEVRTQEYKLRKAAVLNENSYGAEKETKISALGRDIWGESGSPFDAGRKPLDRYNEKLQMYAKDLGELDEDERTARIRSFRSEFFPEEIVRRLERIDSEIASDIEKDRNYRAREQEILGAPGLSDDERKRIIESLQKEIFGDDVESYRRREAIAAGAAH